MKSINGEKNKNKKTNKNNCPIQESLNIHQKDLNKLAKK